MAKAAGSLYRGPGLQVKGFGELSQALQQRQVLDQRISEATKRARDRELALNEKDLEKYATRHAIDKLPTAFVPVYAAYEKKYSELVSNGTVDSTTAIAYLGSLWYQMSSTQGDKFEVKRDAVNDFEDDRKFGGFEKLVNDNDFTKTTVGPLERSKIITDQNDLANYKYFGGDPERSTEYIDGEWAQYWDIVEDENGMPVLISKNGFFDLNGNQIGDKNTALKDYTGFGNQDQIYSQDAFVTDAPVPTPGEFRKPLNAYNTSRKYADGKFHRDDVEKYVGEVYLTLDDKESARSRYAVVDYVLRNPENDPELVDLISEDEMAAYIKRDPNMLGGDVDNRRMRFDMINENANVRRYIASKAGYEGRDSDEMTQFKKSRAVFAETKDEIGGSFIQKVDAAPMDIVNAATGDMILSEYSGDIKTYNVGRLRTGEVNRIVIPNPEYDSSLRGLTGYNVPENLEVNVEQIRVYNVGGKDVIGLVSLDSKLNQQPELYIEVGNADNSDIENALRSNIKNVYNNSITLDSFLDGSLDSDNQPAATGNTARFNKPGS